jgi:hypothetical protein
MIVNVLLVWLIAAMNADKFLAVCLPLRVSDLLSRKKAYAVVIAVISCSMLVASVHASRTVLKDNSYCWLKTPQDEKLVFILDAFFWCFIPFIVISILNAAIFLALLRARREASHLHESTQSATIRHANNGRTSSTNLLKTPSSPSTKTPLRSSNSTFFANNRARAQSQNLQITIMLITISISFFVLTLPNAIYYLLIFLRVLIESWKAVKCDAQLYRNLDVYVRTSAVMYLISNITSDLMHVVNFFLYFISGARFRSEFRRLIFYQLCPWCCKSRLSKNGKDMMPNDRSFIRSSGVGTVRTLATLPGGTATTIQQRMSNTGRTTTNQGDKQNSIKTPTRLSVNCNPVLDTNLSTPVASIARRTLCQNNLANVSSGNDVDKESENLLTQK